MYMDPESQRVVAREIELLGVQHAPQGLQEKGEMEEHFHCSGDVKRGPGSDHTLRKCASRRVLVPAAVTVMLIIIIAVPAVLLIVEKFKAPLAAPDPPAVPCCPDGWIGYRGKCYYFSETDGNWTYSQSQCSALNASLAGIDSEQEKVCARRRRKVFPLVVPVASAVEPPGVVLSWQCIKVPSTRYLLSSFLPDTSTERRWVGLGMDMSNISKNNNSERYNKKSPLGDRLPWQEKSCPDDCHGGKEELRRLRVGRDLHTPP
ncbi:uncharacterized protein LOC115640843 isoform X2 [Gopherus evgoodei]|uniref:uncharacterized protein LOC115640843 isoform X2 n=1 Tax=Gopherus evgoodei TaxID=1825980 RepID=UPI0011CEFDF0|nr:uncharacterized protein LOC115640843 isoform X2 [Gopherus evgoodei]